MSTPRERVLVTGPARGPEPWLAAAERVGWTALAHPLLRIRELDVDLARDLDALPDWIAVTSSNALSALDRAARARPELRAVPAACVGNATAERLHALGFATPLEPAANARRLGAALAGACDAGTRVLWPRGPLSDELAERLRAAALEVADPVVYETEPNPDLEPPPEADAVFFASPSSVRAWVERDPGPRDVPAIALGATTYGPLRALEGEAFSYAIRLAAPTPEAFAACLRALLKRD